MFFVTTKLFGTRVNDTRKTNNELSNELFQLSSLAINSLILQQKPFFGVKLEILRKTQRFSVHLVEHWTQDWEVQASNLRVAELIIVAGMWAKSSRMIMTYNFHTIY